MANKIDNLISDFLKYLKNQNRSELTIRNYKLYLERFLEFSRNPLPGEIDKETVGKYQGWLKNLSEESRLIKIEKNLKKNTINYHLIALRSFLKYLRDENIEALGPEKIELEEMPKRKIKFLGEAEIERILERPMKSDADEVIQLRDKAILEILFATGMRVSELAGLKKGDVKERDVIVQGKKGRMRKLGLTNQAKHFLRKYLDMRTDKLLALFVGHDRAAKARKVKKLVPTNNLTARSVQRIVKKYANLAGVGKKITPQILRNSLTIRLLSQGVSEKEIQTKLGYESVMTTRSYGLTQG